MAGYQAFKRIELTLTYEGAITTFSITRTVRSIKGHKYRSLKW